METNRQVLGLGKIRQATLSNQSLRTLFNPLTSFPPLPPKYRAHFIKPPQVFNPHLPPLNYPQSIPSLQVQALFLPTKRPHHYYKMQKYRSSTYRPSPRLSYPSYSSPNPNQTPPIIHTAKSLLKQRTKSTATPPRDRRSIPCDD